MGKGSGGNLSSVARFLVIMMTRPPFMSAIVVGTGQQGRNDDTGRSHHLISVTARTSNTP